MAQVIVDISGIKELQRDLEQMSETALRRLGERGYQLLRQEIKKSAYVTGNLMQGVSPPDFDFGKKEALLTVTARSAKRGARTATLHLKSGKTKKITLRATPQFNYAETVARGRPAMRAKEAKALLIPVNSAPPGESYIVADGQIYIVRPSARATKPNPFDQRAAKRLQEEAARIFAGVVGK